MRKIFLVVLIASVLPLISYADTNNYATTVDRAAAIANKMYGKVVTDSTSLNVRQSRSTESKVVGKVPKGARVQVLEMYDNWYKIQYKKIRGFVASEFIQIER